MERAQRITPGALAILGGAGVLVATFVGWYGAFEWAYFTRTVGAPAHAGVSSSNALDAWEAFGGLDIGLAVFSGVAIIAGVTAVRSEPGVLRSRSAIAVCVGGVAAAAWIVDRLAARPALVGVDVGPIVALAAISVAIAGAALGLVRTRTRRHRGHAVLSLAAGGVLLASMFLHWDAGVPGGHLAHSYGGAGSGGVVTVWGSAETAWGSFQGLDIALAVLAALSVACGAGGLRSAPAAQARALSFATGAAGFAIGGWTLERLLDRPGFPGLGAGAAFGVTAISIATVAAWLGISSVHESGETAALGPHLAERGDG